MFDTNNSVYQEGDIYKPSFFGQPLTKLMAWTGQNSTITCDV